MIIPEHYSQVNMKFGGAFLPRKAQVTFGVDNTAHDFGPHDIGAEVAGAYNDNLKPFQTTGVLLESVLVKNGPNATGLEFDYPAAIAGTSASDSTSPQTAALVIKDTAHGGRKGKGRFFWPGFSEAWVNGTGQIDPTALASWQTALTAFFNDLAAFGIPIVVLHNDATTPYTCTALVASSTVATQRRRVRKVGGKRTVAP